MGKKILIIASLLTFVLIIIFLNKLPDYEYDEYESVKQNDNRSNTLSNDTNEKKAIENQIQKTKTTQKTSANVEQNEEIEKQDSDEYESKYGELTRSLEGAEIPGELLVDSDGNLIVTSGIRSMFEFFMSARGDEPWETIVGRIKEYINKKLPQKASEQAQKILDSYLNYKEELTKAKFEVAVEDANNNLTSLEDILMQRILLRRKHMGDEVAEVFWGLEEKIDQYTLGKMKIAKDKNLSEEEKKAQLEELEEILPEEVKENRRQEKTLRDLANETKEMIKKGEEPEEIFEKRKQILGEEGAKRWSELDKQRSEWKDRLLEFKKLKQEILNKKDVSEEEKNQEIEELKDSLFLENEKIRVNVIDKYNTYDNY